uniref:RING-type domain-containing protein n=1 Tax=Anabas testudineus TaxID=64144 RepID=A0A3Q1HU71_ANATE
MLPVPLSHTVHQTEKKNYPVSLSCNHSFCSSCLQQFWEQAKNKNCPICKRKSSKDETEIPKDTNVELVCSKHQEEPKLFCEGEDRPVCPVCEFSLHQTHKVVLVEQAVSDLKEQLKSDLKSLQDKRNKYKQVEKTYNDMIEHSKKQLLSTEQQIRAEFNKLQLFLKEEEESRLAFMDTYKRGMRLLNWLLLNRCSSPLSLVLVFSYQATS